MAVALFAAAMISSIMSLRLLTEKTPGNVRNVGILLATQKEYDKFIKLNLQFTNRQRINIYPFQLFHFYIFWKFEILTEIL